MLAIGFFETREVGIIGIFVLVEIENQLEILFSNIIFSSVYFKQI